MHKNRRRGRRTELEQEEPEAPPPETEGRRCRGTRTERGHEQPEGPARGACRRPWPGHARRPGRCCRRPTRTLTPEYWAEAGRVARPGRDPRRRLSRAPHDFGGLGRPCLLPAAPAWPQRPSAGSAVASHGRLESTLAPAPHVQPRDVNGARAARRARGTTETAVSEARRGERRGEYAHRPPRPPTITPIVATNLVAEYEERHHDNLRAADSEPRVPERRLSSTRPPAPAPARNARLANRPPEPPPHWMRPRSGCPRVHCEE